jgi:hypothetical protein
MQGAIEGHTKEASALQAAVTRLEAELSQLAVQLQDQLQLTAVAEARCGALQNDLSSSGKSATAAQVSWWQPSQSMLLLLPLLLLLLMLLLLCCSHSTTLWQKPYGYLTNVMPDVRTPTALLHSYTPQSAAFCLELCTQGQLSYAVLLWLRSLAVNPVPGCCQHSCTCLQYTIRLPIRCCTRLHGQRMKRRVISLRTEVCVQSLSAQGDRMSCHRALCGRDNLIAHVPCATPAIALWPSIKHCTANIDWNCFRASWRTSSRCMPLLKPR